MKCLAIVLSFILVFIRLQVHSSLITPIENRHEHLLNSFKLSQLSSPERPKVFVFLCPPASFVHHQITVALELCRRGHHIVFASTPGFQKHLDNQLPLFQIDNPESSKIDVLEIGQAFDFNGRIKEMTQSVRNWNRTGILSSLLGFYKTSQIHVCVFVYVLFRHQTRDLVLITKR